MRPGGGVGWRRTWNRRDGTGEPGKSSCRSRPNRGQAASLPAGMRIVRAGVLEVEFADGGELLGRLYELVRIAGEDLEAFAALLGGPSRGHEKISAHLAVFAETAPRGIPACYNSKSTSVLTHIPTNKQNEGMVFRSRESCALAPCLPRNSRDSLGLSSELGIWRLARVAALRSRQLQLTLATSLLPHADELRSLAFEICRHRRDEHADPVFDSLAVPELVDFYLQEVRDLGFGEIFTDSATAADEFASGVVVENNAVVRSGLLKSRNG